MIEPLPPRLRARLNANYLLQMTLGRFDHLVDLYPFVRISLTGAPGFWLLSEADPGDPDFFFGLSAKDHRPQLGWLRLTGMERYAQSRGLGLERDLTFAPTMSLGAYLEQARSGGQALGHGQARQPSSSPSLR